MNLYKITQSENNGYDTYDSAIVASKSAARAKKIHPSPYSSRLDYWDEGSWTQPAKVKATYVGKAKRGTKEGVIIASFNAG